MKRQILNILRDRKDVVSGEMLSAQLGISRVAVWKHIQKLQASGYPIASGSKGYRLQGDADGLYPWEFPRLEDRIHFFRELPSTMDEARKRARRGCPHFTVVIAERQTRGRGRLQRTWLSDDGGLYFTVVLRPQMPTALSHLLNFAASLELVKTLQSLCRITVRVKWPNDIFVQNRKLVGLLSEMEAEGDLASFVNIGIGINVNNDPSGILPPAVSLRQVTGRELSRRHILTAFLEAFQDRVEGGNLETVIAEWKQHTFTLGRPVRIVTARETSEGVAVDVDENGALMLQQADGRIRRVIYGDCFHTAAGPI